MQITNEHLLRKLEHLEELIRETQRVHFVSYPVVPEQPITSYFTVTTNAPITPKEVYAENDQA